MGFHLSIAGGPARIFRRFSDRGCTAFQMFLGSPRTWEVLDWPAATIAAFQAVRAAHGTPPVVAHTRYLLNLASANETVRARSIDTLRQEYLAATRVGVDFLVLHMGTHPQLAVGLELMIEGLESALAGLAGTGPLLLLENTAGARNDLGAKPVDLQRVRAGLSFPAGICWDTCHAFQAGFDLTTVAGRTSLLRELDSRFGVDGVRVIHLNDSLFPCGAHRDRHAALDGGTIGSDQLAAFLRSPSLAGRTVILETPARGTDDPTEDLANLSRLRKAFSRAARKPRP